MAFVDELTIYAKAGDGGDGVVRWRRERSREFGGPSGGNGGRGGHIYALAMRNVHLLARYRAAKEFAAARGEAGKKDSKHGSDGKDLIIEFPVGSIITNTRTGQKFLLNTEGERVLLLNGGMGGRGNESFKGPINRSPTQWTRGKPGEEAEFHVELELIADIGFIGLPNAGKTTLLNALTRAQGKVGSYAFTTLEPNLGECFGFIIADIPGLIEGAAEGKGLGHKFLRHVRRTKMLVHLISVENEDAVAAYRTIRHELEKFDPALLEKKEIAVITKTDLASPAQLKKITAAMKKLASRVLTASLHDPASAKALQDELLSEAREPGS